MIDILESGRLRGITVFMPSEPAAIVLTMPMSAIYTLIAVALFLFALAQALGFFHRPASGRASGRLWIAISSLFWFMAGCSLLAIVLHGMLERSPQITLSSPYPEIGFLVLGSAVFWLSYTIYRLWHHRLH